MTRLFLVALILHISGATLLESILMRHLTHFQCVAGIESEECLCTKIQDSNSHCIEGTTDKCECDPGFKPGEQHGWLKSVPRYNALSSSQSFCTDNFSINTDIDECGSVNNCALLP